MRAGSIDLRRWLAPMRFMAFVLAGMTGGIFFFTGLGVLGFEYVPPIAMRWCGTVIAYAGLPLAWLCIWLDRRKDDGAAARKAGDGSFIRRSAPG